MTQMLRAAQVCSVLRGQLGVLQQSVCPQAASTVHAAAPCVLIQLLHSHAAETLHCSLTSRAWRSYSHSGSSGSEAGQPELSTSSSSSSSSNTSRSPGDDNNLSSSMDQLQPAPPAAAADPQPSAAGTYSGSYGPRKVTPRSTKATAGAIKREGIVHVNSTFNNTIMVLTDRDSKVQTWTSGGTVGYKNANKATPMAAELAAKALAKRAVDMGFHSVVVKLKGMGKNKQFAVQSLAANGLTVTQLWDVTPIPHNGCRLPRKRRV